MKKIIQAESRRKWTVREFTIGFVSEEKRRLFSFLFCWTKKKTKKFRPQFSVSDGILASSEETAAEQRKKNRRLTQFRPGGHYWPWTPSSDRSGN